MSQAREAPAAGAYTPAALRERLAGRLLAREPVGDPPIRLGDHTLNTDIVPLERAQLRDAAVLVALVAGAQGCEVILTQRPGHLSSHAGQIAFPGGKLEPGEDSYAAALREAEEEIGLARGFVEPLGFLDPYQTGTGFCIQPCVALLREGFRLRRDPGEVELIFQVPLAFLMEPANHQRHSRQSRGRERHYYAMPFGEHYIWGATAGIIRNLYDRVFC